MSLLQTCVVKFLPVLSNRKQYLQAALVLASASLLHACNGRPVFVKEYGIERVQPPYLSRVEARRAFHDLVRPSIAEQGGGEDYRAQLTAINVFITHQKGAVLSCPYTLLQPRIRFYENFANVLFYAGRYRYSKRFESGKVIEACDTGVTFRGAGFESKATEFMLALTSLKHHATVESDSKDPAFQKAVNFYRSQNPKPQLTEQARRYRVQAESAFKAKSYEEAGILYGEALEIAPWWPDGYYNRALIYAELGSYQSAINDMRRFLELEPGSRDARSVQDKIYEWERYSSK